jgi:GNAT superfamily N-acetyltransferase
MIMKIIDLTTEYENLYFLCLEDWSDEIKEAGCHKKHWYNHQKDNGLRVKLAVDDNGEVGGMIQYQPVECSFIQGENLNFILCIWVHGYKKGRGNFQKKGMGKALLRAAEDDTKARGKAGIAAWGVSLPFWMKASWFKKQGYRVADKQGIRVLLWKPFVENSEPPKWILQKKTPEREAGKVTVSAFINSWCQAQNLVFERAKRASAEFGERVIFRKYDTSDHQIFLEWGITDALYIDEKQVRTGPPPSYEKIRKLIAKRVAKIKKSRALL